MTAAAAAGYCNDGGALEDSRCAAAAAAAAVAAVDNAPPAREGHIEGSYRTDTEGHKKVRCKMGWGGGRG
jgi:hypothetical protein